MSRCFFAIMAVAAAAGLSACNAAYIAGGAAWVATEAVDDKNPFDYAAEFFERRCENLTIYDQPPRCRRTASVR